MTAMPSDLPLQVHLTTTRFVLTDILLRTPVLLTSTAFYTPPLPHHNMYKTCNSTFPLTDALSVEQ
jgi:hypothetical protein